MTVAYPDGDLKKDNDLRDLMSYLATYGKNVLPPHIVKQAEGGDVKALRDVYATVWHAWEVGAAYKRWKPTDEAHGFCEAWKTWTVKLQNYVRGNYWRRSNVIDSPCIILDRLKGEVGRKKVLNCFYLDFQRIGDVVQEKVGGTLFEREVLFFVFLENQGTAFWVKKMKVPGGRRSNVDDVFEVFGKPRPFGTPSAASSTTAHAETERSPTPTQGLAGDFAGKQGFRLKPRAKRDWTRLWQKWDNDAIRSERRDAKSKGELISRLVTRIRKDAWKLYSGDAPSPAYVRKRIRQANLRLSDD